jgi:hypothetical protein
MSTKDANALAESLGKDPALLDSVEVSVP